MKYLTAISVLVTIASSTPTWGANETPVHSMKLNDVLNVYAPCMKNCGMTSQACTSQTGVVASSCTHDLATCMLRCQRSIYPSPLDQLTDCNLVSIDEMSSGLAIDMIESNFKGCVQK